jgi:two-component system, cell cycle sensor histidine kinase and response regulator CckA
VEDALIKATRETLTFEDVDRVDQPTRRFLISKFPLMHPDGTIFAIGGISTEITARQAMERALEERERTARALLNAPTDEIVLITPAGIISDANLAFAFAHSTTREAVIGHPLTEICHLECASQLPDLLIRLAAQRTPIRFESHHADRYLDHLLAPIFDSYGRLASVAIFTRDITALKRGEIERLHIERRLLETQRMESIGVLAGGVAHDFNNLLTGMLGHAELLLLDLVPGSPAYSSAEAIIAATRRAADLTGQLLAYAGKGRFVIEPVQLDDLISGTIDLLRATLPRQIILSHTIGGTVPAIEADPTQIRQVLLSLVRNAGEAIGDTAGEVALKIRSVKP